MKALNDDDFSQNECCSPPRADDRPVAGAGQDGGVSGGGHGGGGLGILLSSLCWDPVR